MLPILAFFLNSSLAPVLRFRRSFVSVCNVLKGIKLHGFSEGRVAALWHRWRAVVRLGPTVPVTSFDPWTHWIPPDLHGFYKWAMDTLALLNEFVLKVVRHRQSSRFQAWSNWIREDLTSRLCQWLRPEFVPPAPYLVCKPQDSPNGSGMLVQPALVDAHFRKAWMPYFFVVRDTLWSPPKLSLILLVIIFLKSPFWSFLFLLVKNFMRLPCPKNLLLLGPRIPPMGQDFWSNRLLLMPTFVRHGCLVFVVMGTPL